MCRKYLFPLYDQHHRHLQRIRKRSRRQKKKGSRHIILSTPFFRTVDKKEAIYVTPFQKKKIFIFFPVRKTARERKSESERKKIKGINVVVFYILEKFVLAQTKVREVEEIIL